jgi:beta-arrestin
MRFKNSSFLFNSELVAELPFTLMHPKPDESERPSSSSGSHKSESSTKENGETSGATTTTTKGEKEATSTAASTNPLVDTNLIQLDT